MKKFQFALMLISFCCLNSFGQAAKNLNANKSDTQPAQKTIGTACNEKYRVYGAILAEEKGVFVIRDETNIDKDSKNIKDLEQRGFGNFLEQITPETITDFLAKNDAPETLENKFLSGNDYTLISTKELKENFAYKFDGEMNWEIFRDKYPKAKNLYTFSSVGFSQDGGKALVFVTNWCGPLCGEGNYYLLKKENCNWQIANKIMTWIS
jgi:hypothetical protein